MTIDNSEQRFNSYQRDNLENQQDAASYSKYRLKNQLLADDICRLLYGESTTLLDDILSHPLSIDYFNVYLSLPIFGQRVFYHRITHELDFDPPLLTKRQTCEQIYKEAKGWLINYRLNNYIHTDIYIESLLGLLLTKLDDSKETVTEEQSYIFSTVIDVRQFHQFLQLTSGIKYWNFFIDSMRLLQSRHSFQSNRIDISYLNFIYKYYSQQHEFRSITMDLNHPRMPDSTTSETIWFQMAINAMQQLRIYWLPRYLGQVSLLSRSKIKPPPIESQSNQIKNIIKPLSENILRTTSSHLSNTDSIIKDSKFMKHTLDNISYLDYSPRQYILIQPSLEHDFQQDTEELYQTDTDDDNNTNSIDKDCKIQFEDTLPPSSDRSIEDYAANDNIELFYRIFVSDSLAGSPFLEYITQTISKTDAVSYQTCIRFITDAEILFSLSSGKFREKILREFISRYLEITASEKLPDEIFDHIEEQRIDLMKELKNNQYPLLWKILLEITKFLIPHFLNYIKFDRLRFLLQDKPLNKSPNVDDLRHRFPLVNFETLLTDQEKTEKTDLQQTDLRNCGVEQNELLNSIFKNQYNTTEKLINTDEQCECRLGERFPPLTDNELEEELRRFGAKSEWKDIKTVLEKSFNVPMDNTTFIGDPLLHKEIKQTLISNEDSKLNSIEIFTFDIMNSAREIFEIDRFILNIMDESLHLFQTTSSLDSKNSDLNSSPLSPIFEEILLTDSSSITSLKLLTNNTNNNAFISPDFNTNSSKNDDVIETKILSLIGSYFINPPSKIKPLNNFPSQSIKFAQKDASNQVKTILLNKQISSFQKNDQQQLLKFIQNQINNHQWPLEEYIGFKGHRAWRALKLAADISNLDNGFMLNYHKNLDWISTDDNFGSFSERTYLIQRNFNRRIEQQKRSINKLFII